VNFNHPKTRRVQQEREEKRVEEKETLIGGTGKLLYQKKKTAEFSYQGANINRNSDGRKNKEESGGWRAERREERGEARRGERREERGGEEIGERRFFCQNVNQYKCKLWWKTNAIEERGEERREAEREGGRERR
jgi:hypothetical protein